MPRGCSEWISLDPEGFAKYILDEINCHWHGRKVNPTKWLAELIKERDEVKQAVDK